MARSDKKFPAYSKYKLDPEEWPGDYWDGSYRCSQCKTNWPATPYFAISPCCHASTAKAEEAPDMRWPDAVTAFNTARFEKYYEEWNEGKTDEQLSVDETLAEIESIDSLTEESSRVA